MPGDTGDATGGGADRCELREAADHMIDLLVEDAARRAAATS